MIKEKTELNLEQFLYAIHLILNATFFKFDGHYYRQTFGTPMGSLLSLLLADIVMED